MNKSIIKRISTIGLLVMLLAAGVVGGNYLKEHPGSIFTLTESDTSQQEKFDDYVNQLFRHEITGNTISMHYTLKNPENYGIDKYQVTYGELNQESHDASVAAMENVEAALEGFSKKKLDISRQLTYDILKEETEVELSGKEFYYHQEPLRSSTGIQTELPVLLAEYSFYREKDVQDYLKLLEEMPEYFHRILLFEMEKANRGMFMAEFAAEDIISQCKNFIADPDQNYLLSTFSDKIEAMEGLSQEQKQSYEEQNRKAVSEQVIPAYEMLIQGLEKLKKSGKNQQGLCYLENGVEYYEYLLKTTTGSDWTVEEMQKATEEQRAEDMTIAAKLLAEHPDLLSQTVSYGFAQQDPGTILTELQEKMKKDFPAPPDTSFTVKYVHPSLEEFMAPAFYLAVPIDDISQNSIYINNANHYQKLKLYTTLAHEGFPGHLYQNIMERSQGFPPIRSILGTSGYSEGWATYVEMISYSYAELDGALATLLQKDQSALLSLYATADLGIHHDGWSFQDMAEFFGRYQIRDEETLTEVYQLIVEEPAHYLKYYIGYLEFLRLKENAKKLYGEQYSDNQFHEALMKMGPARFSTLNQYLPEYYDSKP